MKPSLKVLFVISEADPLLKVGGLGDVGGTLPIAIRNLPTEQTDGSPVDVRIVIPYHDEIKRKEIPTEWILNYQIPCGGGFQDVYLSKALNTKVPIYLIDGWPIRNCGTYNADSRRDMEKYIFFSAAALELCKQLNWSPDILHAHDWHTAASVMKLAELRSYSSFFKNTKSLYTIHNLPYSGGDCPDILEKYGIRPSFEEEIPGWNRNLPMALGLSAADRISTVSETYAKEIMTQEFGHGYENFLRSHADKVCGIVNGLMPEQWDPATDKRIYVNYDVSSLDERRENKRMLQQEVGLAQRDDVPLFVMIGRMDTQKGIDLITQGLRRVRNLDWQAVILGTGNPDIENDCRALAAEFPDRVRSEIRFDGPFSRKMYAGGDVLLMPSRYEPCGIAQMIAMLYGCVPLAHATGGLRDTIIDPMESADYTGFLFENADVNAAEWSIRRAVTAFADREEWRKIQIRGMKQNFSWEVSAKKYYDLYRSLERDEN